jgi:hypothetical protein
MPTFNTIFRATVMLAVGAVVFKGWQMYGPPAEQVKSIAARAMDVAQAAWKNLQSPEKNAQPAAAPQGAAPGFAQTPQAPAADFAIAPPALSTPTLTPSPPPGAMIPSTSAPAAPMTQAPITPLADAPPATVPKDDRVQALLSRLEQLGGADSKLAAWGSSGHLFRCCCQAPLTNSPAVTQHFESVAAEPALAVEQVVAKVEAWQMARRNNTLLR